MDAALFLSLAFLSAYLIGSVPFGYLVARWRGVDIFTAGSGNVGATNVGRVLGRRWGMLVFVLDFAKGAAPTVAAMKASEKLHVPIPGEIAGVVAGLAAFLGHLLPVFLRFRGGKGVATGAGIVAVLLPGPALAALSFWAVVVVSSRAVSLASLSAATLLCCLHFARGLEAWSWPTSVITAFCFLAAGLIFWKHRTNLGRLIRGQENRLKDSPAMFLLSKVFHVLSVGLWFGMTVFFTFVVGVQLFATFDRISVEPRPLWFPLPPEFTGTPPSPRFPDPLRKEQGIRAAGAAVSPLFDWYYRLQMGCGVVALVTALGWSWGSRGEPPARMRTWILAVALVTVVVGWWLAREINTLRDKRSATTDAVLTTPHPSIDAIAAADQARENFARWHLVTLLLNFVTVLVVAVAMGLTAALPQWQPETTHNVRPGASENSESATEPVT